MGFLKPPSGDIFVEENASQYSCRLIEMQRMKEVTEESLNAVYAIPSKITIEIRNK
jgi:hypothetical protein